MKSWFKRVGLKLLPLFEVLVVSWAIYGAFFKTRYCAADSSFGGHCLHYHWDEALVLTYFLSAAAILYLLWRFRNSNKA
jgi:hypothetical protein